jgi:hypothetical protein
MRLARRHLARVECFYLYWPCASSRLAEILLAHTRRSADLEDTTCLLATSR